MKRIIILFALIIAVQSFYSFTVRSLTNDFLKHLGLTKTDADGRITESILHGDINTYGLKKGNAIPQGIRAAVARDILAYTKQYVQSEAFKKRYESLRQSKKPTLATATTPEENRASNIARLQKSLDENNAWIKKADPSLKAELEKISADIKKDLAEAKDPNSKKNLDYAQRYPQYAKDVEFTNQGLLKKWEQKYPADHMQFVKPRLIEFLEVTEDVDFGAELVTKNGKQVFVNPQYQRKDFRWKMAFRAGKEVTEPARAFVQQWLAEIK
ncbi:MAG TPA: hypothetical protein VD996_18365 [Chitinophagaceae bacterium]|nr:hypothetical protein [Chitinophagaceae bacterium]